MVEAEQRFEQFQLDLVTRTSGAMTAEMQLRELMGLPRKDDRRIVPATKATEALVDPDWDKSLAVMLEKQPDVVRSRALVKESEADRSGDSPALLESRKDSLRQIIHETTHSTARFFLETGRELQTISS